MSSPDIREAPIESVAELARVSIAFTVDSVFDVSSSPESGFILTERVLATPHVKDYDSITEGPGTWSRQFDVSRWGFLTARLGGTRHGALVGGAVVAFGSPDVTMLEGRQDLAVLWDIRVAPELRGTGIGRALFEAAERWALARGCRELKIETQNVNVRACRFYERRGCVLRGVNPRAYPHLPDEVQLLWYESLAPSEA